MLKHFKMGNAVILVHVLKYTIFQNMAWKGGRGVMMWVRGFRGRAEVGLGEGGILSLAKQMLQGREG